MGNCYKERVVRTVSYEGTWKGMEGRVSEVQNGQKRTEMDSTMQWSQGDRRWSRWDIDGYATNFYHRRYLKPLKGVLWEKHPPCIYVLNLGYVIILFIEYGINWSMAKGKSGSREIHFHAISIQEGGAGIIAWFRITWFEREISEYISVLKGKSTGCCVSEGKPSKVGWYVDFQLAK